MYFSDYCAIVSEIYYLSFSVVYNSVVYNSVVYNSVVYNKSVKYINYTFLNFYSKLSRKNNGLDEVLRKIIALN